MTGRGAAGAAAAICATAALLTGCGSSSGPSRVGVSTVALTRAADVSSASPGYRVAVKLREAISGAGAVSGTASGSFNGTGHLGAMTMQMTLPTQAGIRSMRMQMVVAGQSVYLKLPGQAAGQLPGGKPWVSVDLARAGQAGGVPGMGSLMNSSASLTDPGQYLDFLRATSIGSVRDLGQAIVDGRSTTHYRAEVDMAKLADAVPRADRQQARLLIVALESRGMITAMPIDVWIDRSQLVRRVRVSFSQSLPTGQSVSLQMTESFLEYGPQPAPVIPSPSETSDLLSLLKQAG